jgi:hypothetical protein
LVVKQHLPIVFAVLAGAVVIWFVVGRLRRGGRAVAERT